MNTLLFIDPQTGEKLFYEELRESLSTMKMDFSPLVQPATPAEAVRALLTAVILGQPLTLFDADFSAEERIALGGTETQLAKRIRIAGGSWTDTVTMRNEARQQTGFTLTLFTSGTTGRPMQVTHSLEGLTRMLKVRPSHAANVWGLAYNPTHIAGVQVILQAFFNGNPLVNLFQGSRETIVSALDDHKVTHLSATPSFYRLLLPLKPPCTRLRAITLGGERSDTALLAKLREAFPSARIRNLYASTEVGTLLVAEGDIFGIPEELEGRVVVHENRLWVHRSLVAASPPPVNKKLKIENREAASPPVPTDRPLTHHDSLIPAAPAANPLTNDDSPLTAAGAAAWHDTGDDVEIVSEDPLRFRIVARERDWVNVGGHKVNPHEVEALLRSHPDVREARVFGRKSSVMGQVLCAEVALRKVESGKLKAETPEPLASRETVKRSVGDSESGRSALRGDGGAKQKAEMDFGKIESGEQKSEITEGKEEGAPLENEKWKIEDKNNTLTNNDSLITTGSAAHPTTHTHSPLSEAQLRAWLSARLQAVKVPRMIRFVDNLGTTRTGKMKR